MIDFGAIGGVLLIFGAIALYRGNAQWSIIWYGVADLCWLGLAFSNGDIFGSIMIIIGIALGIGVYLKMNKGLFVKNLKTGKNDPN